MKTLKQVEITPVFLDSYIPNWDDIEENKLYISEKYHGSIHKCFCGCGQSIYIDLNTGDHTGGWDLIKHETGKISIHPSLLHFNGCKSHYIITKNKANFV